MRFLIAGFGSIGRRHFRNLLALGERDVVFYRTFRGALPDDETAGFPVETDLEAALARRPDAVIVSNPTAIHLDVAIPAARAGCHLLLEKPVSDRWERVAALQDAVRQGGGSVLVGYHFRFHPGLQALARALHAGEVGRPAAARAHWGEHLPDWHPWEDYRKGYSAREDLGGGVVLTLSHPLDYLRWLLGEVESVWAATGHAGDLDLEVESLAEIVLRFTAGALGSVHLDYLQRPPAHRLEIVCTEGTLRWNQDDGVAEVYSTRTESWRREAPPGGFERNDLFLDEMRHFVDVIRGEAAPRCTLEDGLGALKVALGALRSHQEGKPIPLHD